MCVWYGGNRGCCISSVCGLEANVWVAFVWGVTLPCVVPWALWTYSHPEHVAFYFYYCEALSFLPVSNGNGWKGWGNSLGSANLRVCNRGHCRTWRAPAQVCQWWGTQNQKLVSGWKAGWGTVQHTPDNVCFQDTALHSSSGEIGSVGR